MQIAPFSENLIVEKVNRKSAQPLSVCSTIFRAGHTSKHWHLVLVYTDCTAVVQPSTTVRQNLVNNNYFLRKNATRRCT